MTNDQPIKNPDCNRDLAGFHRAIASVTALVFVWTFGELLNAATILQSNPDAYTLPLAATTQSTRETVNLQGQAAAALVSLIPVLFIFALAQKSLAADFGVSSDR